MISFCFLEFPVMHPLLYRLCSLKLKTCHIAKVISGDDTNLMNYICRPKNHLDSSFASLETMRPHLSLEFSISKP